MVWDGDGDGGWGGWVGGWVGAKTLENLGFRKSLEMSRFSEKLGFRRNSVFGTKLGFRKKLGFAKNSVFAKTLFSPKKIGFGKVSVFGKVGSSGRVGSGLVKCDFSQSGS